MLYLPWNRARGPVSGMGRSGRRSSRDIRPVLGVERFEERTLLSASVVSLNAAGTAPANSVSDLGNTFFGPGTRPASGLLSADGKSLVFESQATDLVNSVNDTNHAGDIFVRNLATNTTAAVSVTPDGTATGNAASSAPVISPNGRYVAFLSQANNLTAIRPPNVGGYGPTTGGYLYLRDLHAGTTVLLDATPDGKASDGSSAGAFVFSPDSKSLAFVDSSDNLTAAPVAAGNAAPGGGNYGTNPSAYVYVRDLAAQSTALASVSTDGKASSLTGSAGGYGSPTSLVFSPDGRELVFSSAATDLTTNSLDNSPGNSGFGGPPGNLFLRDLGSKTTTLISVMKDGRLGVDSNTNPVFSPDGHLLAFTSSATNLTDNPAPPAQTGNLYPGPMTEGLFVRDLSAHATTLVSVTPAGKLSSGFVSSVAFSPDSHSLAFVSNASDLTSNPADPATPTLPILGIPIGGNAGSNVFVRDLTAHKTALASITPGGTLSNGSVSELVYSPDGHSLAFASTASDLTNNSLDPVDPSLLPATVSVPGNPTPFPIPSPVASFNANIFIRDLAAGKTALVTTTPDAKLSNGSANDLTYSSDGRSLFFESSATDLTENAPDLSNSNLPYAGPSFFQNLFVRDMKAGTTSALSTTPAGMLSSLSSSPLQLAPDGQTVYYSGTGVPPLDLGGNVYAAAAPFAAPKQVHFASWQFKASESSGPATITVVRSAPLDAPASVNYSVQDDTARTGTDYSAASGTLHFAAGQAMQTFPIALNPADHFVGTKSAKLVLSGASGVSLGVPSAVLTLSADPAPLAPPVTLPAPTPAPGTPTAAAHEFGPFVLGVTPHAARHAIAKLDITFNKPLNSASASNLANYHVNLPGHVLHARRGHVEGRSVPGRVIKVAGAVYNPATHGVTLTLGSGLKAGQAFQLAIKGTPGGLTDASSNALQSRGKATQGQDYVVTLNQTPARR